MHPIFSAAIAGGRVKDRRREAEVAPVVSRARKRSQPPASSGRWSEPLAAMARWLNGLAGGASSGASYTVRMPSGRAIAVQDDLDLS